MSAQNRTRVSNSFTKNQVAQLCIDEFWQGYIKYAPYDILIGEEEFWDYVIERYDGWRFQFNLTNKFAENLCIEFLFNDFKEQPYDYREEQPLNPSSCWLYYILWKLYRTFGTTEISCNYFEHWDKPDEVLDIINNWRKRSTARRLFDEVWEKQKKKIKDAGLK